MRTETDDPQIAVNLRRIAEILTSHDGFVADDFVVRQRAGEFSCAIGDQLGVSGRVLVSYPPELTVPMWRLEWSDNPDAMEVVGGLDALTPVHRELLDEWLPLVNLTGKLRHIRAVVPQHAVQSWSLRHHLADAGYPRLRTAAAELEPKETLLAWHSTGGRREPPATEASTGSADGPGSCTAESSGTGDPTEFRPQPRWRLIPLKHLVNHDPSGATQDGVPGRSSVVTSATSNDTETFENYGDLDALQLLMSFGYVASDAPLVHSVPLTVEAEDFGRVQVLWRAPRYGTAERGIVAAEVAANVPQISATGDGFALRHLTLRPANRPAVSQLLAMAAQSRAGMPAAASRRAAEGLLDLVCEANLTYYRSLDLLVAEAFAGAETGTDATSDAVSEIPVLSMLAEVSLSQQQAIGTFWG